MRAIQLDFLTPDGRSSRLAPYLLGVGLLAALGGVAYQREVSQQVVGREAQISELRRMAARTAPALAEQETDTPEVRSQIQKANGVLEQMNIPWGQLFAAVESAENADVALLAVQPDPRSRAVLIAGQGRSIPVVLAYMERLERTKRLRDVVLQSHEVKTKEPGQPVGFTVAATWVETR
jgi:hypothetical protein